MISMATRLRKWIKLDSIHGRLNFYLIFILGGLLALSGLGLNGFMKHRFQERFDAEVLGRAQMFITLTEVEEDEVELEFANEFMPEFSDPEGPEFFQLWFGDGTLLERSQSLLDRDLPVQPFVDNRPRFSNIELDPGGRCRLVQVYFRPENETLDEDGSLQITAAEDSDMVICLARNRESFDAFLHQTQLVLLVTFLALLLGMVFFVKAALEHGLKPLDDMRLQVARLDSKTLANTIKLKRKTSELVPVVDQLNAMLAKLNRAMEQERQFTSNVAHELRTPIAELKNLAEVGDKMLDSQDAITQFFDYTKEIAWEMEQIVVNLLSLSRCDNGTQVVEKQPFDLCSVVYKTIKRVSQDADRRQVTVNLEIPPEFWLKSDEVMSEQVIQNLVNNAVHHCPANSQVFLRMTVEQGGLTLCLENDAPELQTDDLARLFDRFWQKCAARTGGQHAGLGLSLVAAFTDLLGFEFKVNLDEERRFHARILIPEAQFAAIACVV